MSQATSNLAASLREAEGTTLEDIERDFSKIPAAQMDLLTKATKTFEADERSQAKADAIAEAIELFVRVQVKRFSEGKEI